LDQAEAGSASLTRREREVLASVAKGKCAREIGEILHIAKRTVDEHVQDCRSKARGSQPDSCRCDSPSDAALLKSEPTSRRQGFRARASSYEVPEIEIRMAFVWEMSAFDAVDGSFTGT
jgi:hypothetical protein